MDSANQTPNTAMPVLAKAVFNNLPKGMLDALILSLSDPNFLEFCVAQEDYFRKALSEKALMGCSDYKELDQLRQRVWFWMDLRKELTNYSAMMGV